MRSHSDGRADPVAGHPKYLARLALWPERRQSTRLPDLVQRSATGTPRRWNRLSPPYTASRRTLLPRWCRSRTPGGYPRPPLFDRGRSICRARAASSGIASLILSNIANTASALARRLIASTHSARGSLSGEAIGSETSIPELLKRLKTVVYIPLTRGLHHRAEK